MPQDQADEEIDAAELDRIRSILSNLDDADFELLEPPEEIWIGIASSIASETPTGLVVEYWLDADDVVTEVGDQWAEFARDNDAPELAAPAPDRTLWSYIGRDEIREIWQLLVARVRDAQASARVPFRCDAPHARRWFDMTITPEPDGRVHFRSVLAFEEPRPVVTLLDLHAERDPDAVPVALCSWCGRGQHGAVWLDVEELVTAARLLERVSMPPLSHGICGQCRDEMSALLSGSSGRMSR